MAAPATIPPGALTLAGLAAALDVDIQAARYLAQLGMPAISRGGKGRGNAALYDLEPVRAWLRQRQTRAGAHPRLEGIVGNSLSQAREFERVMADTLCNLWRAETGPNKVLRAGLVVAEFMAGSQRLRDMHGLPSISDAETPASIKQMQRVCLHFRTSAQSGMEDP